MESSENVDLLPRTIEGAQVYVRTDYIGSFQQYRLLGQR
jgi:hypothetical protein